MHLDIQFESLRNSAIYAMAVTVSQWSLGFILKVYSARLIEHGLSAFADLKWLIQ